MEFFKQEDMNIGDFPGTGIVVIPRTDGKFSIQEFDTSTGKHEELVVVEDLDAAKDYADSLEMSEEYDFIVYDETTKGVIDPSSN